MPNKLETAKLLNAARNALESAILPELEDKLRNVTLMVISALAISIRDIEYDNDCCILRQHFNNVYGKELVDSYFFDKKQGFTDLNKKLVRDIRKGIFDHDRSETLLKLLETQVLSRVRTSNPSFIDKHTFSQPGLD